MTIYNIWILLFTILFHGSCHARKNEDYHVYTLAQEGWQSVCGTNG